MNKNNIKITSKPQRNSTKLPKWAIKHIKAHTEAIGGKIDTVERFKFQRSVNIPFSDLATDIEIAINNRSHLFRFSIEPLQKPKFIAFKSFDGPTNCDEVELGIIVRPYDESMREIIPFCGMVAMGPNLITAADTDDKTAELMIGLYQLVWEKNLYNGNLKAA